MTTGSMHLDVAAHTHPGRVREHNEDAFLLLDLDSHARASAHGTDTKERALSYDVGERGVVLAVSDGMGGAAAGEVASAISVQALVDELQRDDGKDAIPDRLNRVVVRASRRVREAGKQPGRRGMGATLTAALVCGDNIHLAQIGDSRAYLMRDGQIHQVTHDQSYVQMMVDEGVMTPEEAERSPQKNVILQVMGQKDDVHVDLGHIHVHRGDVLLLCSDGLSNALSDDEIHRIVTTSSDVRTAAKTLVQQANRAGGPDNITVVVAAVN